MVSLLKELKTVKGVALFDKRSFGKTGGGVYLMKGRKLGKGKGFTLLELLIVIVVLAILAGLALPQYVRTIARSREAEGWQNMATLRGAEMRYYAEWDSFTDDLTIMDITDPNAATNRYFDYAVAPAPPSIIFTITADPAGGTRPCPGCRTLTLDDQGNRTEN